MSFVDFSREDDSEAAHDGGWKLEGDDGGMRVNTHDTKKQQIRIKLDEIISIEVPSRLLTPSCRRFCDN